MNKAFYTRLQGIADEEWSNALKGIQRGFEKECLRIDKQGRLAHTPHPNRLGAALTHPMITTDYSEALLEFITPPMQDIPETFSILTDLHHFTYQNLTDELLWANSMPCLLPTENEIPIAYYGLSNHGQMKHIYRQGLGHRYGRKMQTIAGIHYNFSFPEAFFAPYQTKIRSHLSYPDFVSEQYLGMLRNCLRLGGLLPLLFGASPAVSSAFLQKEMAGLEKWGKESFIGPYATSLRLSDLGYSNKSKVSNRVSYNSLPDFLATLHQAIHTPHPTFAQIGTKENGKYKQLSGNILQTEDEHYALVRPKRVTTQEERMVTTISEKGIEYIEIRAFDINPFYPLGVNQEFVYVLDAFLLLCLLLDSPPLGDAELKEIEYNQGQVAKWGRKPGLMLSHAGTPSLLKEWALSVLEGTVACCALLDKANETNRYTKACQQVIHQVSDLDALPSARVLQEMRETSESFIEFGMHWSLKHQAHFMAHPMAEEKQRYFTQLAKGSLIAEKALAQANTVSFDEYLQRYLIA